MRQRVLRTFIKIYVFFAVMAYVELVALLSAAAFGLSAIFLKKGYERSTPLSAAFTVLLVNVLTLWIFSAATGNIGTITNSAADAVIFFAIGGLLGQALARTLQYTGIDKVGPARNHTVLGTSPVFAAIFAVLVLREKWELHVIFGTLVIMAGIAVLAAEKISKQLIQKKHLFFPFTAAAIYGFAILMHKMGLEIQPNALAAATIATTSALLGLSVFTVSSGNLPKPKLRTGIKHFAFAGFLNSLAFLLNFEALSKGAVSIVMPLVGTQALFATLFSFLLLRGQGNVTKHVILGALLTVSGAALITYF